MPMTIAERRAMTAADRLNPDRVQERVIEAAGLLEDAEHVLAKLAELRAENPDAAVFAEAEEAARELKKLIARITSAALADGLSAYPEGI